jgi:hypothetical protein
MISNDETMQPSEFLPVIRVPRSLLPSASWHFVKLTRRNGRTLVACLDMTGMIYGVLVPLSFAEDKHPADFNAEEIVACESLNERWQRFLLSKWCPPWWRRQVI